MKHQSDLSDFELTSEGKAIILAPRKDKFVRPDGEFEPSWAPVFYNPLMSDNRSLTVISSIIYNQTIGSIKRFAEPLAGSCVRSIRMLIESGIEIAYANDIDPFSVYICRYNSRINNVSDKLIVFNTEANLFNNYIDYNGIPVDFVDIDPYGTPIYYLQSSLKLIGKKGLVSVTATDIGTLEGKYPSKAFSRYGVLLNKNSFSKETAARVLIYVISRFAAFQERSIEPLIVFYDKHFIKIIAKVEKTSSKKLEEMSKKVGFVAIDEKGLPIRSYSIEDYSWSSQNQRVIGPMWIGPICNTTFLDKIFEYERSEKTHLSQLGLNKLRILREECEIDVPFHYNLSLLARIIKTNLPKMKQLIEVLRNEGYRSSRTHFDPLSIKTNASVTEVINSIKYLTNKT